MNSPDETGGFITWNTLKILKNEQKYNFTIDREWLADALCSNPITWDSKKNADYSKHKGLFPNSLEIDNIDTGVFLKTPKIGLFRTLLISTLKDYHKADINLFWEDIRQNSVLRAKAYFKNLAE